MKKLFLIALAIILYNLSNAQIKVNCAGNVGIGVDPSSYKFKTSSACFNSIYANGNVDFYLGYAGVQIRNIDNGAVLHPRLNNTTSLGLSNKGFRDIYYYNLRPLSGDLRQKENIRDINNALVLVLQLKGIEYDLKKEYVYIDSISYSDKMKEKMEKERKDKFGFIAQDVEKVIPQVVFHDDTTDIYTMDYTKIIPVLVEAIKEQQSQIELLQAEIEKSISDDSNLKSTAENNLDNAQLFQNQPNPFNENTVINYYIPEGNQKAIVYIYDLNGSQKKAYKITTKSNSSIVINGSELQPGMYLYTLIVDGKEVDTKRMILMD